LTPTGIAKIRAPEVNECSYGFKSDLWLVGVLLY